MRRERNCPFYDYNPKEMHIPKYFKRNMVVVSHRVTAESALKGDFTRILFWYNFVSIINKAYLGSMQISAF